MSTPDGYTQWYDYLGRTFDGAETGSTTADMVIIVTNKDYNSVTMTATLCSTQMLTKAWLVSYSVSLTTSTTVTSGIPGEHPSLNLKQPPDANHCAPKHDVHC